MDAVEITMIQIATDLLQDSIIRHDPLLCIVRKYIKKGKKEANQLLIHQIRDFMKLMNYEYTSINPYLQRIETGPFFLEKTPFKRKVSSDPFEILAEIGGLK